MSHYNLGITNQNYRAGMRYEEITNEMCGCGCGKTTARCELDRRIEELSEQRRQEQERQVAENENDANWLTDYIALHPPVKFVPAVDCQHDGNITGKRTYAIAGGMFCPLCRKTIDPRSDFEKRLVSAKTPRGSGWVNYK